MPLAVAASLANRSDVLARVLRSGDGCAARIQMHGLERQTRLAIGAGRIAVVFRARLLAAERRLAGRMPRCVPPPPPPEPVATGPRPKHEKKHEDHPKPKKHGGKENEQ
jgi:hypothetical protein